MVKKLGETGKQIASDKESKEYIRPLDPKNPGDDKRKRKERIPYIEKCGYDFDRFISLQRSRLDI